MKLALTLLTALLPALLVVPPASVQQSGRAKPARPAAKKAAKVLPSPPQPKLANVPYLQENARQALRLERNNPFCREAALAKLDEHGVVRLGITVRHGDVLVSVLAAKQPFVRRAAAGKQWATDDSWLVPETWDQATVADARVIRQRGAIVAAEVTLRRDVLLEIGDWLMATRPQDEIRTADGDPLLAKGDVGLGVVSRLVAAEDWPAPPETVLLASSGVASHFDIPAGRPIELCVGKAEATGAAAIRRLLAAVPFDRWPQGLIERRDAIIQDVLLVPPPDVRPLVLLDSGNFATADINDLYRQVISLSNRLSKLRQLNAPATILFAGQAELQHILDAVMFNSLLPDDRAFFAEGSDKRLVSLGEMLLDLPNQRRRAEVSKPVAWSGRSRAVIDPVLAAGHVGIPAELCDRLGLHNGDTVLLMSSVAELPDDGEWFAAATCVTVAGGAIRVTAETYRRLRLDLAAQGACVVHRPLGQKALEEARQLVSAVPPADSRRVAAPTWLDANDVTEFAAGLIGAAIHGHSTLLNSRQNHANPTGPAAVLRAVRGP